MLFRSVASRSANDLAWDCLGVASALNEGVEVAGPRLKGIADEMAGRVVKDRQGQPKGWAASIQDSHCPGGGYDAFNDGTCNDASTVYAFQSGLGMACLAIASEALKEPRYLDTAKQVLRYWERQTLQPPCGECVYFATSDNPNDRGRYVRNMNVFVGFGALFVGTVGRDAQALKTGRAALQSDVVERRGGNRGYLGKQDPAFAKKPAQEANRIENHSAAVAVMALEGARLTGSDELHRHALQVWRDWAKCDDSRCIKADCKYWAGDANLCQATTTASHCAFRQLEPDARQQCTTLLSKADRIGGYGLYSYFLGRSVAESRPAR